MKGLTHFLSGQGDLSEILCKTNEKGLFVIFAGPVPPNPAELLWKQKVCRTVKRGKKYL